MWRRPHSSRSCPRRASAAGGGMTRRVESGEGMVVSDLEAGRNRLRETIKWLIASFGAIGASFAVGGQLSNVGALSAPRLSLALLGAVAVFGGILYAMWAAVKTMTGSHLTLEELVPTVAPAGTGAPPGPELRPDVPRSRLVRFFEDENPMLLGTHPTIRDLVEAYRREARKGSTDLGRQLGEQLYRLLDIGSYEKLRIRFDAAIGRVFASVAVAAA